MTFAPGLRALGIPLGHSFFYAFQKMLHGAFDLSGEDLIDRISPVREICSQRILRQNCYFGPSSQLFGSRMPRRDDSEKENGIRLLQELLGLKTRVKRMSARKINIAGGAAFDDASAQQL